MKKFLGEFKAFALKGNMIDLSVGIIIGSAFTSIVNSLVKDIFMPILSLVTGKVDFTNMFIALDGKRYATLAEAQAAAAATVNYGSFITQTINFLLMALVVFIVVKQLNRLRGIGKKQEAAAPAQKECPFCKTMIPQGALRCPNCTSRLEAEQENTDSEMISE